MPMRWVEAAVLFVLSLIVAGPLSMWFARARWTAREPIAALIAWQAIGLSGGLALVTAELTVAASNRPGPWRSGVTTALAHLGSAGAVATVGLTLFGLSLAWLGSVLIASFAGAIRARRGHRLLLELLSTPCGPLLEPTFDVVQADTPLAYSLPGKIPRVVLSSSAVAALTQAELHAVLAHERAHLRQRHSVLVQPFVAWQHSLPFLRAPLAARHRVEQLAEMACDDSACRTVARHTLASALVTLDAPAAERIGRLGTSATSLPLRAALLCGAVMLVCLPPVILLGLSR